MRVATGVPDVENSGPPFALQVEVTSRCNLKCRMCPLTTGGTLSGLVAGDMEAATWDTVMDLARQVRQVFVAGYGEPFSNDHCGELLAELDAAGVTTTLVTNGMAVTPAVAAHVASLRNIVHVNVSIDSPDPECYRAIRGGSLRRALRGLGNLMAALDEPERVSVSSVAMEANIATLRDFPALLETMGVRQYVIQGLWDYNDYSRAGRLAGRHTLQGAFEDIVAEGARRGVKVQLTMVDRSLGELADPDSAAATYGAVDDGGSPTRTRRCTLPWELPYVDRDGRVYSCCYAASIGAAALGRLGDQSFTEIWTGPSYGRFRRALVDGRHMPDPCRTCTAVPLGRHRFAEYWAEIGEVEHSTGDRVRVSVRNAGAVTWAKGEVLVGSCRPRDGQSPVSHPSWVTPSRPGTFDQAEVAPGDLATFNFAISRGVGAVGAHFAAVVEGVCWLPGTEFSLDVRA